MKNVSVFQPGVILEVMGHDLGAGELNVRIEPRCEWRFVPHDREQGPLPRMEIPRSPEPDGRIGVVQTSEIGLYKVIPRSASQ